MKYIHRDTNGIIYYRTTGGFGTRPDPQFESYYQKELNPPKIVNKPPIKEQALKITQLTLFG